MNIPEGDKPWRDHLMGVDGCVKNARRIQALKKSKEKNISNFLLFCVCFFKINILNNNKNQLLFQHLK